MKVLKYENKKASQRRRRPFKGLRLILFDNFAFKENPHKV
jgi:hypothetical protein